MSQYGFSTDGLTIINDFKSQVTGKIFLITGPSSGSLGGQTAISLAHGNPHTMLLLGRTLSKIQPVIDAISTISPTTMTKYIPVSLASLSSIRSAAAQILENREITKIDVIINNAGVMAVPFSLTEDSHEMHLATNHLSHFLLTNLLLPLVPAKTGRIINLSSGSHIMSPFRIDDPNFSLRREEYNPFVGYAQSKTANILFTVELNRRLKSRGIKSFALHPGAVGTGIHQHVSKEMHEAGVKAWESMGKKMPERKTVEQGCSTTLRAALDPSLEIEKGVFLTDCQIVGVGEELAPFAVDEGNAVKCWEISEELLGQKFDYGAAL